MVGLAILFAILAIIFGVWSFAATAVWVGAKILFWSCVVLFVLFIIGSLTGRRTTAPPTV